MPRKAPHEKAAEELLRLADEHEAVSKKFREYIISEMERRNLSYDRAGKITDYSTALFYKVKNGVGVREETLRALARALASSALEEKN